MKIKIILLMLCVINISTAQILCSDGTIDELSEGLVGIDTSSTVADSWLFQYVENQPIHPDVDQSNTLGGNCPFNILFPLLGEGAVSQDKAMYTKEHFESSDLRFRFILNTKDLLNSLDVGKSFVLYKFEAYSQINPIIQERLLKVRMEKRSKDLISGNTEWRIRIQWFDKDLAENTNQYLTMYPDDNFVEIEFFWRKIDSVDGDDAILHTQFRAGTMIKIGIDARPKIYLSPYTYEEKYSTLSGKSSLGYINSNQDPAKPGDMIRILSPKLYSDVDPNPNN